MTAQLVDVDERLEGGEISVFHCPLSLPGQEHLPRGSPTHAVPVSSPVQFLLGHNRPSVSSGSRSTGREDERLDPDVSHLSGRRLEGYGVHGQREE